MLTLIEPDFDHVVSELEKSAASTGVIDYKTVIKKYVPDQLMRDSCVDYEATIKAVPHPLSVREEVSRIIRESNSK